MSELQSWAKPYTKKGLANTVDELQTNVERLRANNQQLRAHVDDCQRAMVELSKSNADMVQAYSTMRAERDDLAAKLAVAQAELHELRIKVGQFAASGQR